MSNRDIVIRALVAAFLLVVVAAVIVQVVPVFKGATRNYADLSEKVGIQVINDGEAVVALSALGKQDEDALNVRVKSAILEYQQVRLDKDLDREARAFKDNEEELKAAFEAGKKHAALVEKARQQRHPCGSAAWRPCNP